MDHTGYISYMKILQLIRQATADHLLYYLFEDISDTYNHIGRVVCSNCCDEFWLASVFYDLKYQRASGVSYVQSIESLKVEKD